MGNIGIKTRKGKPEFRWIHNNQTDATKLLRLRNWKRVAKNRDERKGRLPEEEARRRGG